MDYNFGTLIRRDASKLYSEDNTVLVTRAQFFALEVSTATGSANTLRHVHVHKLTSIRLPEIGQASTTRSTRRLKPRRAHRVFMLDQREVIIEVRQVGHQVGSSRSCSRPILVSHRRAHAVDAFRRPQNISAHT
jgi:hypothetical protein